jgi:hypothetical protein
MIGFDSTALKPSWWGIPVGKDMADNNFPEWCLRVAGG